jgi:hypothetical protein
MKSKPQTPRGTKLVNGHAKMPRKVENKVFVGQPSNPGRSGPGPP